MSAPLPRRTRPASSAVLRPSTAQSSAKLSRVPSSSALATSASSIATTTGRRATHSTHHGDEENARPTQPGSRMASGKAAATSTVRRERAPTSASDKQVPQQQQRDGLSDGGAQAEIQDGKATAVDGTNIEVVVRCRGRSSKEIAENSPIIVSTAGAIGPTLTVETSPISTSSSLSLLAAPTSTAGPTRTYTFDKVFGPEADQGMLWDEVVRETLDEVMMGYNCTIFAYGQTGTGKTYTMQGDLVPNTLGNPSSEAGIVPRTLHRLFAALDAAPSALARDSSVKISFVEIYNEDIRDLLSASYAGSSSAAAQPMGVASSAKGGALKDGELRIYEDPNPKGRGVVIQGLEEVGVRSAKDGIELLRKGSGRRETGETLMNATSSRSHSIFSITVHVKETSSTGEDLLKVGKLNLVDLAGSENIGRSGAVETRAREAGMINQSLLTLGRVINSLVKKSSHIPYRESKLTRLLQDSLGGRTKTRIIATISPSRSNLEETLSTIDYAMRATRIMNRPEVNQKMTKNGLISEYVAEIEGLKKDLLAAREKNGIYITAEDYAQLNEDAKLHSTQIDEAKSQHVILNNRLSQIQTELRDVSVDLLATKKEREELLESLAEIGRELEIERRAVEEFEQGEQRLDGVAHVYKGALGDARGDLAGLFAKKDRTASLLTSNAASGSTHAATTLATVGRLSSHLGEFAGTQAGAHQHIISETNDFKKRRLASHATVSEEIAHGLTSFGTSTAQIDKYLDRAYGEYAAYRTEVEASRSNIEGSIRGQSTGVKKGLVTHEAALRASVSESMGETRRVADALSGVHELAGEIDELQKPQRAVLDEKDSRVRAADVEDVVRLTSASTIVTALVTSCEQDFAKRRTRLGSSLLERMTLFQQRQAAEALAFQQTLMAYHEQEMDELQEAHTKSLRDIQAALQVVKAEKEERARTEDVEQRAFSDRLREVDERVLQAAQGIKDLGQSLQADLTQAVSKTEDGVASGLSALTQCAVELIDAESVEIAQQIASISNATEAAASVADKTLKKQRIALKMSRGGIDELLNRVEGGLQASNADVESSSTAIVSSLSTIDTSLSAFTSGHSSELARLRDATTTFQETGLKPDEPTGATPRKRQWDHIPATWARTGTLAQVKDRLRAAAAMEVTTNGLESSSGSRSEGATSGTVSPSTAES